MSRKVALVITSHQGEAPFPRPTGYWREEVSAFYRILRKSGFEIVITSPKGGEPPLDAKSAEPRKPDNAAFLADTRAQMALRSTIPAAALQPEGFSAIYFAGGHGAMWDFPVDPALGRLAAGIFAQGGIIATVCHGAAALLNPAIAALAGPPGATRATGFSNLEERLIGQMARVPYALETDLREAGWRYERGWLPFRSHVVCDGQIISGQNPASTAAVARAVVAALRQPKGNIA